MVCVHIHEIFSAAAACGKTANSPWSDNDKLVTFAFQHLLVCKANKKKETLHQVIATISNGFNLDVGDNSKSSTQAEGAIVSLLKGQHCVTSRKTAVKETTTWLEASPHLYCLDCEYSLTAARDRREQNTRARAGLQGLARETVSGWFRSPRVGASISPTGFVPQHWRRPSYFWNEISRSKTQGGHVHPIKWF